MRSATLKPCGYGPRGDAAYAVIDEKGEYVSKGAWIVFTREEALAVKERYEKETDEADARLSEQRRLDPESDYDY